MLRTFKYRIYPTKEQIKKINETLYLCRYLYNNALEQRITAYQKYGFSLSYNKQAKELPKVKQVWAKCIKTLGREPTFVED